MKIATPDIIFRWPHEAHEENTTVAGLRTHSLSFADFRSNHPEGRLDRDASASVQRSRRTSPEASHLPGHHASSLALGGPAVGRSSICTCRTAFVTNHSALSAFCGANTTRQSRTSPHDGRLPSTDGYPPISSARTSTALKPSGNRGSRRGGQGWMERHPRGKTRRITHAPQVRAPASVLLKPAGTLALGSAIGDPKV